MKLTGQGVGRVFQQGVTYEANWSKANRESFTRWTQKNGLEVKLVPGQTWIEVMPKGAEVSWE
ncbi:MAG: hypothetical protein GX062_05305 [Firmicutes bacterium]|nr:hypothetical protein [Bacillota bacterium]